VIIGWAKIDFAAGCSSSRYTRPAINLVMAATISLDGGIATYEIPANIKSIDLVSGRINKHDTISNPYCDDSYYTNIDALGECPKLESINCGQLDIIASMDHLPAGLVRLNGCGFLMHANYLPYGMIEFGLNSRVAMPVDYLPLNIRNLGLEQSSMVILDAVNRLTAIRLVKCKWAFSLCNHSKMTTMEIILDHDYNYGALHIYRCGQLTHLYLSESKLSEVPQLPPGLVELDLKYNYLTALPMLPKKLRRLILEGNDLTHIDIRYLTKLYELDISINGTTKLSPIPASLRRLSCDDNDLEELVLHDDLEYLNCRCNPRLATVKWPYGLKWLACSDMYIGKSSLPDLLKYLECINLLDTSITLPEQLVEFTVIRSPSLKTIVLTNPCTFISSADGRGPRIIKPITGRQKKMPRSRKTKK
jgi:hypothetical protein